jgi:D-glycero-alpha-D-manno-heptose-7-phosphate kinase
MGMLGLRGGLEITSVADIPSRGTGLGSSSSFAVGLMHALHAIEGRHVSSGQLADEACRIEIEKCGEPIGKQDQYAAAFGGLNYIQFRQDGSVQVDPIVLPSGARETLNRNLLMFYTGITRSASEILANQSRALAGQGKKVEAMHQMVAYAAESREALCSGDFDAIGRILHENWLLKQSITDGIGSDKISAWYERALHAGALGGKLLGAGGGGFLLFYAPQDKHESIASALSDLRRIDFALEARGSKIIFVN